jgi:hypothetical protein
MNRSSTQRRHSLNSSRMQTYARRRGDGKLPAGDIRSGRQTGSLARACMLGVPVALCIWVPIVWAALKFM